MAFDEVGYLGGGGGGDKSRVNGEVSNVEDGEVGVFSDIQINRDKASKNTGS